MSARPGPPLQRPRALLLDAMGTLIHLRRPPGQTYAAAAARHGIEVESTAIDRLFPAILRSAPPLAFPRLRGEELAEAEVQWWGDRIEEVLQAAGSGGAPQALKHELFEEFGDPSLWFVHEEVREWIGRWHGRGLRMAVVSNFDRRLHGLLEALGLNRWLEVVVVSSQAGAAKPSPAPFRLALQQLGVPPQQAWHLGDSAEDVEGARAAGLQPILLRRG
jgi:putative hydrolase of the HAD superfamily